MPAFLPLPLHLYISGSDHVIFSAFQLLGISITNAEYQIRDPERGPALDVLPYRSIQIGIGPALSKRWADEWILSIEDVTERALVLREAISNGESFKKVVEGGWMPIERAYEVNEELRTVLKMDDV